jgi:hypothetical protein
VGGEQTQIIVAEFIVECLYGLNDWRTVVRKGTNLRYIRASWAVVVPGQDNPDGQQVTPHFGILSPELRETGQLDLGADNMLTDTTEFTYDAVLKGVNTVAKASIDYYWAIYFGASTNRPLTSSDIDNFRIQQEGEYLIPDKQSTTQSVDRSFDTGDNRACVAFPAYWGPPSWVKMDGVFSSYQTYTIVDYVLGNAATDYLGLSIDGTGNDTVAVEIAWP